MKELIYQILNFWSNYWGDSLFSYLLILAAAYLLIFKRKEKMQINKNRAISICNKTLSIDVSLKKKHHIKSF